MARELTALGEQPRLDDGGVSWNGDARSVMRANLWLRTASRVLVRVAQFEARTFFELERQAGKVAWDAWLAPGVAAEFRVTARKSRLYHTDAIAERLGRQATGSGQQATGNGQQDQLFVVRVVRDRFEISVDSSGDLLHMRGYRQAVGKAPLRETLAAALLLGAGWTGDTPLVDPLCGSGTIPIEAALIARRMAPGATRPFALQAWPGFDASAWARELALANERALPRANATIVGSDRDAGAIAAAEANAARAGVAADVAFSARSLSAAEAPDGAGLIATNPPYGKRVSPAADVRNLYAQLARVARARFQGWKLAVYSPDARLTSQLGATPTEMFRTSNGGIRVTALAVEVA